MDGQTIIKRFNALELRRSREDWDGIWQQCTDYVLPRMGKNNKKNSFIFDSTAPLALSRFAAAMESYLTPRSGKWHNLISGNAEIDQMPEVMKYHETINNILFRLRYMPQANFANQMLEVYLSLGVLGTACLFVDDDLRNGMRYRAIPIHEIYMAEDFSGVVDVVFRKYSLTARQAASEFGDELPEDIIKDAEDPQRMEVEHEFIHAVFPKNELEGFKKSHFNVISVHLAFSKRKIVRESGYRTMPYAVTRFSTVTGDIYGRSPAMDIMPDIVQVNAMKQTIIRASEKMVSPPLLLGDDNTVRPFSLKSGSLNMGWLDMQGRPKALPLTLEGNLPIGMQMIEQSREAINHAFFVTLFQVLVERTGEQTATEVVQRAQEKAQLLAPAMGRQQSELLRPIIERELDIIIHGGSLERIEVPPVLLQFGKSELMPKYITPMAEALESNDAVAIMQAMQALSGLAGIDDRAPLVLDGVKAARDVCQALGVPARDLRSEEELQAMVQERQQAQQMQMLLQAGQAAATGLEGAANAEKSIQQSRSIAAQAGLQGAY